MKSRIYFLFVIMVISGLVFTTSAAAQGSPPGTPPVPNPEGNRSVTEQTLALGKPGWTFRYTKTFGTNGQAYLPDADHLNGPSSLFTAPDGNGHFDLYVTEGYGSRLLKYNFHDSNDKGMPIWQSGTAGLADSNSAGYAHPTDAAIAQDGTLWTTNADNVTHTAANGTVLGHFPADPVNAIDPLHFVDLRGIAFDSGGRMYLSDTARKRIQVFTMSGGLPDNPTTLVTTDAPGQIAIDGSNNVYVVAPQNNYVQRCTPNSGTWPWTWTCTSFDTDLSSPRGLGIDTANNLYIADSGNKRIVECTAANTCTVLVNTGLGNPSDVTVTPDGEIYITDDEFHVIWQYTGTTTVSSIYAGQNGVPYLTDNAHFNWPRGITIDSKGAVIVLEENGQRMIKMDKNGTVLWARGTSGVTGSANNLFDNPRAITNDAKGTLYVGDNNGVRIFSGVNGLYISALSKPGDDKFTFNKVTGIAVDSKGYIYVSDKDRHRVTVYDKYHTYLRQIGVDDQCAIDNQHLCAPMGITVDTAGNLYIADSGNYRVQKFDKNGNFLVTIGTTLQGNALDRMNTSVDVAVDSSGYIYVADEFNNRVLVFDKTGAFSTSIGGAWGGTGSSQFRHSGGVGIDVYGNVYIADSMNSRIQRFSRRVNYFSQKNINGFGSKDNWAISSLGSFKGQLYAGTFNLTNYGTQIWRKESAGWVLVVNRAFEDPTIGSIESMLAYNGYLYVSTGWGEGVPGQIWRSPDGLTWQPVMRDGFNDSLNISIQELFSLGSSICGTTRVNNGLVHGAEIWCSPSGDPGTWTRLVANGFGNQNNTAIPAFISVNGILYAGTDNSSDGAQIWRKDPTHDWTLITTPIDFKANGITIVSTLAYFKPYLYIGLAPYGQAPSVPAYRCKICDGTDWQTVNISGVGNPSISLISDFIATSSSLYAIDNDPVDGAEIWKSGDGIHWKQVGFGGLGDSNNIAMQYGESHALIFGNSLYWGSWNSASGGEIWKYCPSSINCQ